MDVKDLTGSNPRQRIRDIHFFPGGIERREASPRHDAVGTSIVSKLLSPKGGRIEQLQRPATRVLPRKPAARQQEEAVRSLDQGVFRGQLHGVIVEGARRVEVVQVGVQDLARAGGNAPNNAAAGVTNVASLNVAGYGPANVWSSNGERSKE